MKRIIVSIVAVLTFTTPALALSQQSKAPAKQTQASKDKVYLTVLNQVLAQGAPVYLNVSNQDKLKYGRYTCQALNAKVPLNTVFANYIQAVIKDVSPELRAQAGYFVGSSMGTGVEILCPQYKPQLNTWAKAQGFIQ